MTQQTLTIDQNEQFLLPTIQINDSGMAEIESMLRANCKPDRNYNFKQWALMIADSIESNTNECEPVNFELSACDHHLGRSEEFELHSSGYEWILQDYS